MQLYDSAVFRREHYWSAVYTKELYFYLLHHDVKEVA